MLTLPQIRELLKDRNLREVAKHIKVHHNTLLEIRRNPDANPKTKTLEKISDYLKGKR